MSANETADFVVLASGASFSEQTVRDGRSDPRTKVIDQYDLPHTICSEQDTASSSLTNLPTKSCC